MTNTKSFLAKAIAIACLVLRERMDLELSHVLGVRDDRVSRGCFVGDDRFSLAEPVSRVHQHQAKQRSLIWANPALHVEPAESPHSRLPRDKPPHK